MNVYRIRRGPVQMKRIKAQGNSTKLLGVGRMGSQESDTWKARASFGI